MQINRKKIIKNISVIIVLLIVILLLVLGVQTSKFSTLKKYEIDKFSKDIMSNSITAPSRFSNDTQVTITGNNVINLGDFTFNISENKKLIANISLKYRAKNDDKNWLNSEDDIKKEILKKSAILRDATINAMMGKPKVAIKSEKMRKAIKNALNKKLFSAEVEEVYFNKFIIQ